MPGLKTATPLLAMIISGPALGGVIGEDYSVSLLLRDDLNGTTMRQNAGPDTVTFDGVAQSIPGLLSGGVPTINESIVPLPDGRAIITIEVSTGIGGGEFWAVPSRGEVPEPDYSGGAIEIGLDAPLDLGSLATVDLARVTLFEDTTKTLGPMDFTSAFSNPWDGVVEFDFPLMAGFGINGAEIVLTVSPTPGSIALLGLAGVTISRRRRS